MDPTTAALIGAAIGGGASILAGTIGPWVDRRARARADLRAQTRDEVLAVIEALAMLHRARITGPRNLRVAEQHTAAALAITRLVLLVDRRDRKPLRTVLGFALDTVSSNDSNTLVSFAVEQSASILERWYRGELRGRQIEAQFQRALEALKVTDRSTQTN